VFTDGQTDGQKEKSITIYLAVHSVHLADIITDAGTCKKRHKACTDRRMEPTVILIGGDGGELDTTQLNSSLVRTVA